MFQDKSFEQAMTEAKSRLGDELHSLMLQRVHGLHSATVESLVQDIPNFLTRKSVLDLLRLLKITTYLQILQEQGIMSSDEYDELNTAVHDKW